MLNSDEQRFMTIKEVSILIRTSVSAINKWLVDGKIPSYKVGKKRLFRREEILEWMERQKDE